MLSKPAEQWPELSNAAVVDPMVTLNLFDFADCSMQVPVCSCGSLVVLLWFSLGAYAVPAAHHTIIALLGG